MSNNFYNIFFLAFFFAAISSNVYANVRTDIFVVVSGDARSHVFRQSITSDRDGYIYELPDDLDAGQLLFVDSPDRNWKRLNDNSLVFPDGNFSLMYRHRFAEQIRQTGDGVYEFNNASGQASGFATDGGFESFSFTWILPDSMKVESYSSNIPSSQWQQSHNILRFKTEQQNDISLQISFRRQATDNPGKINQTAKESTKPLQNESKPAETAEKIQSETIAPQDSAKESTTKYYSAKLCESVADDNPMRIVLCDGEESVTLDQLTFERNSASLSPDARKLLDTLVEPIRRAALFTFEIAAYTDSKGPQGWNRRLSTERAQTVRLYLIFKGVKPEQLVAKGYGEKDPVTSNKTPQGRQKNRRLVIRVKDINRR